MRAVAGAASTLGEGFLSAFFRSVNPMLIADDERSYVEANEAACRLLGLSREEILVRSVDDLTPHDLRDRLAARWASLVAGGSDCGTMPVLLPDGSVRTLEYCATANIRSGRHLVIVLVTPWVENRVRVASRSPTEGRLTEREGQILALVATGETGEEIADRLVISATTVQSHVRNALAKLGARNRAHGIALALRAGQLPDPGDRPTAG